MRLYKKDIITNIKYTLCVCAVLYQFTAVSQTTFQVMMDGVLTSEKYTDTLDFSSSIQDILQSARDEDYALANLDSLTRHANTLTAHIYRGDVYKYGDIKVDKQDWSLLSSAGLRKSNWRTYTFGGPQVSRYMDRLLTYLENSGFPFANISLDSIQIENGEVDATLMVDRGPLVLYDSLVIRGDADISESYLRRYLQIQQGEVFDRSRYKSINKRLRELPFLGLNSSPRLRFYDEKAEIYLDTKKKKSNRFDFLIGVLPSTALDGTQQLVVTGEFTAELHNKLGYGEYIFASFERLRPDVLELDLKLSYPYVAGLPIGVQTGLQVYRRTSEFIEVEAEFGLDYQVSGQSHALISWQYESSRLVDIDTLAILDEGKLPKNLDVTTQGGKLGFNYNDLDYRWNPSKGLDIQLSTTIGQKRIIRNQAIQNLSFGTVDFVNAYDSLQLRTLQLQSTVNIAYYTPLARIVTLKTGLRGGLLYNEAKVFQNEYFRIGGYKLLRGFDEQSVLAESYGIFTTEMRLLLNQDSYLTLPFIDVGYTRIQNGSGDLLWDQVIGLGIGINFSTPAGLFNVSFASGGTSRVPIDFGNPKVHFGYVSLF